MPELRRATYLRPEYLPELERLHQELSAARPNVVVALGNTACWGLLRATNISAIRGAVTRGAAGSRGAPDFSGLKILPTYHPAGVLRQWQWRPIVCLDLVKAQREAATPEIVRPARRVLINPTIEECESWVGSVLSAPPPMLACDIETGNAQIKCVGFARSRADALVIPFYDPALSSGSYWTDHSAEWRAWQCVRQLLECDVPKLFQNGLYDLQYLLPMGFRPRALGEDTMLLHHAMWPEMQKGLGFLGSIYTSEPAWKLMVRRRAADVKAEKRDE